MTIALLYMFAAFSPAHKMATLSVNEIKFGDKEHSKKANNSWNKLNLSPNGVTPAVSKKSL